MNLADANKLFLKGAVALAKVEAAGMRVDVPYLDRSIMKAKAKIHVIENRLKESQEWGEWRKLYGSKANFGSRVQLGQLMAKLGHEPKEKTPTGRPKMDEEFLASLDSKFVKSYLFVEHLKKAKSTYLDGLKREVCEGFVHPSFHLNTVDTFRSSSSDPNVQNVIVRDERMMKIVRRCFVPRPGCVLCEIDYGALEFRICACFWRDKTMLEYAADETKDIHRDSAADIFGVPAKEVEKKMRYVAKNLFVFPQLYGSYYVQCARNIWDAIDKHSLITVSGIPVKEALRKQVIENRGACDPKQPAIKGTFEQRIKDAESGFYGRFSTLKDKMQNWWERYRETGEFEMMTGFRVRGAHSRNFLLNAPVQGPAFHCLLWSLIRMQKELRRRKMKSLIIAEIHDSMLADVPEEEVQDFFTLARRIMTEDIRKEWDWIACPLIAEAELCQESWAGKVPWIERGGIWVPK